MSPNPNSPKSSFYFNETDLYNIFYKVNWKKLPDSNKIMQSKSEQLTSHQIKKSVYKNRPSKIYPPLNLYLLSILIWMIVLLGQSTKAESVFLESCSSSNINQVFCHNDQLYVIQDKILYYGNSCGQMMTNETIRITKKFKTAIQMNTAFIDERNNIFLFGDDLVLTTSLDNRNVADVNNISQVILDYFGSIKYTVFEPFTKNVYVIDNENKMILFNSKIFSHTGSIKWGKDHNKYNLIDLNGYPFDYFFFAGNDLIAKIKNRNNYVQLKNFGSCLIDMGIRFRNSDFEHCFNSISGSNAKIIPLKILVCTEIQYMVFMILLILLLLILLLCCLRCCYACITDKGNGGESYYVKQNEDRFLKKLFKKYPKDRFNQFLKLYQENKINPVKLDPDSLKNTKPQIYDLEVEKKQGYQTETKYPTEIKHPIELKYERSLAPIDGKLKKGTDKSDKKLKKDKINQYSEDIIVPKQIKPHEFVLPTKIAVNHNNNNLVFIDNNCNFERASLILEDYAENKPDIDLKEPKPYGDGEKTKRVYMKSVYESNRSSTKEHIIKVNESSLDRERKEFSSYQTSTPKHSQDQAFSYSNKVEIEEKKSEYSLKNIIPNFLSIFKGKSSRLEKDPMTKF